MRHKVNISIDDVSPHPRSSANVLERCFEMISVFPDIKFTLFVPTSYWRTMGPTATRGPLRLDIYPEFCELLLALPKENFEIGYHGHLHGIPGTSNNDEFKNLSYEQTTKLFEEMYKIADAASLTELFKPVFRPPAWKMSPDALRAAKDSGIEVLALTEDDIYQGYDKQLDNVVYYNANPPFKPLNLFEKTEIVYHACEWDRNYLNVEHREKLESFLEDNIDNIEFCFMDALV
tara:strand:- start:168 stop:866 length:699 start_codon:yes stop_codon:yes gene_type:complete